MEVSLNSKGVVYEIKTCMSKAKECPHFVPHTAHTYRFQAVTFTNTCSHKVNVIEPHSDSKWGVSSHSKVAREGSH